MLKVTDRFTTRDGSWEPNNLPFSITQIAAEKYNGIPGQGAAHHIFVRVPQGASVVEFNTQDGKNPIEAYGRGGQWVNFPMFSGHKYDPNNGEVGPGLIRIDGEKVAEGIGLPYGWHVSTFLVVEEAVLDGGPGPSVPPVQGKDKVQLIVNGVIVWEN